MRKLPLLICLLLAALTSIAQPVRVLISAGSGLSFVSTKHTWGNHKPISSWNAGVSLVVPLPGNFRFETGLGYEKRGYKYDSTIISINRVRIDEIYKGKEMYHYLVIPLQLSYCAWQRDKHALFAGAGMNYGILLSSKTTNTQTIYMQGEKIGEGKYDYKPKIGLMQENPRYGAIARDHITRYRFDVGIRAQVSYFFKDRYMARLSYNYSLYDVHASVIPRNPPPVYKQHNIGVTLGVIL